MLKKIKTATSIAVLSAGVVLASTTTANAMSGFSFGMDNNGPFMRLSDGPSFWHFNMFNPMGRYGSYGNSGYNRYNGYNNSPWNGGRYNNSPWNSGRYNNGPWNSGPWNSRPWNSFNGGNNRFGNGFPPRFNRWSGSSPFGGSPWGSSPWGGSPWSSGMRPWGGSGMFPMTGFSPLGGFSPF